MKKFFVILVAIIFGVSLGLPFLSFNGLKPKLISHLNQLSGGTAEIFGDIRLRVLPKLELSMEKVNISVAERQILNAQKVSFYPSMLKLLSGKLEADSIAISGGDLNLQDFRDSHGSFSRINKLSLTKSNIKIDSHAFINGVLDDFDGVLILPSLGDRNFKLISKYKVNDDTFELNAAVTEIDEAGNSNYVNITYGNALFKINFEGKISSIYDNPDFDGIATLNLSQIASTGNFWNDFVNYIIKDENLSIKGVAKANRQTASITDIKINSTSIKDGQAKLSSSFGKDSYVEFESSIKHVDLNKFKTSLKSDNLTIDNFVKKALESFNLVVPERLVGSFRLNIDRIAYNNADVKDFVLEADIIDNEFFLSEFDAKMPGNTIMDVSGILNSNGIRPKFNGNINLTINNLKEFSSWLQLQELSSKILTNTIGFKTEFSIIPRNLKFYNMKAILGDTLVTGKYMVRHSGEERLNSKLSLRFNEFDSNQYNFPNLIDSIIFHLYLFDGDKTGNFFLNYTNDFALLRAMPINMGVELEVDRFKYKNTVLEDFQANLRLSPNNFYIDQLSFHNDFIDTEVSGQLGVTAFFPRIEAIVTLNKFNLLYANQLFPAVKDLQNYQMQYFAEYGKNNKDLQSSVENYISGDFNFFSCHNFLGNIKLNLKDISSDKISIQDANLDIDLVEGAININPSTGKVFGGSFQLAGNIGNSSIIPSFNFTFGLGNFAPDRLLSYFYDLNFVRGYASISGYFSSMGKEYPSFFSNLNGSAKMLGRKITVSGFDISELVKLTEKNYTPQQQAEILNTYTKKGESLFDDTQGAIEVNKGIGTIGSLTFSNSRVSGAYSASIDIYNGMVSGAGRISFRPYGNAQRIDIDFKQYGKFEEQGANLDLTNFVNYLKNFRPRTEQNVGASSGYSRNFTQQ